ncbi:[Ribosomal protein S18]-alanine N-acetyltransferase [Roseobacter fucihabitans]|uniref:[Ribosomal protein S18]-alanine N-acetyltransferase n=1 Tax=Roseobacter fucihabitans TaxID=1537242 RepID=A0ABZ2BZ48_9RHOB|nr:GNAT family N-acetyltransferase [Roseobacter litoralis]MBC6968007.1 ribosomal-protein-alanine N-acetyltransferase [Roseobacter litoralis]
MTPQALADLHRRAFMSERAWSAQEFSDLLSNKYVSFIDEPGGFALIRSVAGEDELLTLAVDPACRRQGIADRLMSHWLAKPTGNIAFLEVAADNTPARRLYEKHGFAETGRRKAYYARDGRPAVDALLMSNAPKTFRI